jgi:hypothetical protein
MLIDYLEAPLLQELKVSEEDVVRIGRVVMGKIAEITGKLPVYVDICNEEGWTTLTSTTLDNLGRLVDQGQFHFVTTDLIHQLEHWAFPKLVLNALRTTPGYVHGDLGGDNLFILSDGYRVIDWQRPLLGPTDLDLATLIESQGFDPLRHVDRAIVWLMYLLHIYWLTQCAVRWIPEGKAGYDKEITRLVSLIGVPFKP